MLSISRLLLFASFFLFQFLSLPTAFGQKTTEQKIVSGTVLLREQAMPDMRLMLQEMKTRWKLRTDSVNIADKTLVFNTSGGATVMIAFLPYPVAIDELGAAARLSWLWSNAEKEAGHSAQMVVSVIGNSKKSLDLYKIFTQVAAAVMESSKSPGVYLGSQYLLLSADFFKSAARNMVDNQSLPLYCWVYFGRPGEGNGFTYGMEELGLPELEIVNSARSEAEVHAMLYDVALSIIKYSSAVQDGQSVATEEGAKIVVKSTKGTFLEDKKVLQLDF